MKIKLTADTRVLLSAGTVVEVSNDTAAVIKRLGRCEFIETRAEKKAEEVAEAEPEEKTKGRKKATKKEED